MRLSIRYLTSCFQSWVPSYCLYPHDCLGCPEATCQDLSPLLRRSLLMVTVQFLGILSMHGSCISLNISSDQIPSNNTLLSASHFMTSCCFWKCNRNSAYWLYNILPRFLLDEYRHICIHCQELMKLVGSHGSSAMLFMMKVMVWHFFSDSHKVMTAPIVI
jgi:hypothetical protein